MVHATLSHVVVHVETEHRKYDVVCDISLIEALNPYTLKPSYVTVGNLYHQCQEFLLYNKISNLLQLSNCIYVK